MGQFFKFLFASCLGVFLAMILLAGLGAAVIFGIAQSADQPKSVAPNSVLRLTLSDPIPEKTNNLELSPFDLKKQKILGLREMVLTLEQAAEDDNIKGILLDLNLSSSGIVSISILRDAMLAFRESGKFIIAYGDYFTQDTYYLATAADKIYLNPVGRMDFRGFAAIIPFFKDMLDRIGAKAEVFYAGKFKSATEPYRRNDMSDENRRQIRAYLDEIYGDFIGDIAEARGLTDTAVYRIADEYLAMLPEDALHYGLVDELAHRDAALTEVRDRLGLKEDEKILSHTLVSYNRSNPPSVDYRTKDKIAILFAEGAIQMGKGENGSIGDQRYIEMIREIRRSEQIKAIVLRVNSPGGNALASENIWAELMRCKEEGKPIVVSMGDLAASGGYYISMAGDSIFADPNTLTGSIGVFSIFPNLSELSNEKLGIHWDTVRTGRFSTALTPFFPFSEEERQIMQRSTDRFYQTFLMRVAEGRNLPQDSVDAIAQGRVWTGQQAQKVGLVDRLAGLETAIDAAAGLAGLEKYRITEFPRTKEPLQQFLEEFTETESLATLGHDWLLRRELGDWYPYYQNLRELRATQGMQARLPFYLQMR